MQQASFSGTLRLIIEIIAFYYIARFVVRLIFPVVVKKAMDHAGQNLRNEFERQQRAQQAPPTQAKPKEQKKVGEYVDFEEID